MYSDIMRKFAVEGEVIKVEPFGNGHINETYIVYTTKKEYILQRINNTVFVNVDGLMSNIDKVTAFLYENDKDPRHVMRPVRTLDNKLYAVIDGKYWRVLTFIENSVSFDSCDTPEDFEMSARAFGEFQNKLAKFPADTLTETIEKFHDTPNRYVIFKKALASDPLSRAKDCKKEIEFALEREKDASHMTDMLLSGKLPLRVTHNDTKLNNVLFDKDTREPLCVVDLDTVMPGLAGNDFGDSIRFGASTALEDERDLDKVHFSLPLYRAYARGFLGACGSNLTDTEIDTLNWGSKLMTLECGVRFLTDHILGDTYFKIHRENHNLDRCRTQFKLVSEMEQSWQDMIDTVDELMNR